jgi:hypothetical protein
MLLLDKPASRLRHRLSIIGFCVVTADFRSTYQRWSGRLVLAEHDLETQSLQTAILLVVIAIHF